MKRRSYSKLVTAVHSTPWAILPEKLQEICGILELRQRGVKLTRAEIRARVGDLEHPPLVQYVPAAAIVSQQALSTQPRIAVLNLYGTIAQRMNMMMEYSGGTSTELFGKAFDQAVADDSVVAIVINVDSPGGTVPGTRELAEKIYAARGAKTIVAIANPMMASAAYWIASAAEEVVSQPSGVGIGSIGVLNVHREESKANADAGITYTVLRSVEQKAAANPWEPLSEAARHDLQANVEKTHAQFAAAVAKHRGLKVSAVDEKFGEGRSYQAQDALSRGLIDRIVTFEALLTELSGRADAHSSPTAAKKRRQSTAKESAMDPKVKAALVRAGLARANATDEEFKAALALHYACLGKSEATDVAQILADLAPVPAVATTTVAGTVANPGAAPVAELAAVAGSLKPAGLSAREIMGLVASAGAMLSAEEKLALQKELVSSATALSLDQVLDKINAKVTTDNPVVGQRITVTADRVDKFQAAARDEILAATWGPGDRPKEIFDFRSRQMKAWEGKSAGQNYGLQTPVKIAQQCMLECGVSPAKVLGLSKADIAQIICGADPVQMGHGQLFASVDGPAYNVSGMFSNILLDATNVILRRSYNDGKTTFQVWMRNAPSIEDFKPVHKVIAGELGDPKAIPEDGEFEEVTLTDGKESYKLVLWGEIFSHSWELLTNDRLGSLTEIPVKMGRAFKRKQNRLAYGVLKDNAALADTVALFHSSHSNATTGALTTSADYTGAFGTMSKKMREQRGLDSNSAALNLSPRWVIFPPAIRDKMLVALGSTSVVTSANAGEINIWKGMLEPVEEAELGSAAGGSETAFYQAADHADIDTIEYAYLQGLEAPRLEQAVAFTRLAIKQRMFQAFAIKAIDYRGLQRHAGA